MLMRLARQSLWHRRGTALLTLVSLAVSVALLLGIDHLRREAKSSFASTISGTDLIVGARSGSVNLLLHSVFRIGFAEQGVSWASYQDIAQRPMVAWTIPIALGDSHRGNTVLGTTAAYYEHFRYGAGRALEFTAGHPPRDTLGAVVGASVARRLGYALGDEIVIAHGLGGTGFVQHDAFPFTVVGILAPTGTPVDQTVHVSLDGLQQIHGESGDPTAISAFFVGLKSRLSTFQMQREINQYRGEALSAILPGVALTELWQMLRIVESLLLLVAGLVLVASLVGMVAMLLVSVRERRRELAILRALGASPLVLFLLIEAEILLLTVAGLLLGLLLLGFALAIAQPWLASALGLHLSINLFTLPAAGLGGAVLTLALVMGAWPALSAYRSALHQGLGVQ